MGQFCETCIPLYYRPTGKSKYDPDVCVPCQCSEAGVKGQELDCEKVGLWVFFMVVKDICGICN